MGASAMARRLLAPRLDAGVGATGEAEPAAGEWASPPQPDLNLLSPELQSPETRSHVDSGVSVRTHLPTDALPAVSASSGPSAVLLRVEASTYGFGGHGHSAHTTCLAGPGTG